MMEKKNYKLLISGEWCGKPDSNEEIKGFYATRIIEAVNLDEAYELVRLQIIQDLRESGPQPNKMHKLEITLDDHSVISSFIARHPNFPIKGYTFY